MSAIDDTKRKVVAQFHEIFGGENGIVDKADEVTPLAAQAYSDAQPFEQKAILESLLENESPIKYSFFQNNLVLRLHDELITRKTMVAQRAAQSLFYFLGGMYGDELPPFVNLTGDKWPGNRKSDDLNTIFLFINIAGHRLPVIVSEKMLESYRDVAVEVDGLIDSMALIGRNGSKAVLLNGFKWPPHSKGEEFIVEKFNSRGIMLGSGKTLTWVQIPPFTWPASLRRYFDADEIGKHDYFFSGDFHYDARLRDGMPQLAFKGEEVSLDFNGRKVSFRHRRPERLGSLGLHEPEGDVEYRLFGDAKSIDDKGHFNAGIEDISKGLSSVIESLGFSPVKHVDIYPACHDYVGVHPSRKESIVITSQSVMHMNLDELKAASAHEAAHLFALAEEFADDSGINAYYETLSGDNNGFLDFITESNFHDTWEVGHPKDSIHEFLASLIQTLFDIDKLKMKLDGLPDSERSMMLECYADATDALLMAAKTSEAKSFLENAHALILP